MPPRAMPSRVRPAQPDLSHEDFDEIRDAVMETARGRWFLDEYATRLRTRETTNLLDSMKRLENAVSANHDALMARLAGALAQDRGEADEDMPAEAFEALGEPSGGAEPTVAPRHMKYYRADEDIFEPAPQATIAAVPDIQHPAEPARPVLLDVLQAAQPKQRIVIIRHKPGEQIEVPLADEFAKAS